MNKKKYLPLVVILLLGIIGMVLLQGSYNVLLLLAISALFVGLFAWVIPVSLQRVNVKVWITTGLLILFGLLFPTSSLMSGYEAGPLFTLNGAILFFLPALALVNAAFLLFAGLNRTSPGASNNRAKLFPLALSALLIVKTLHNLYDLTLWDNTYDPLGYLWLIVPIFAVLVSGLALSISLANWSKLTGPMFSIFTAVLLIAASASAQSVDIRRETVKQAQRTVDAVESYYVREGSYPETLSQLGLWYAVSHPKPMIIHGQDWCYQSGGSYYRLGYIDRKHWSDPNLIGRVYKSVGDVPDLQGICITEFNAIQNSQPDYPYTYVMEGEQGTGINQP